MQREYETTKTPRHIQWGLRFGLLLQGQTPLDYYKYAVDNEDGYETGCLHGVQGSGKSSRALQYTGDIIAHTLGLDMSKTNQADEAWDASLDALVFKPADFVTRLEAVPDDDPLPVLLWDDIQAHYTSSTFKTNIEQYAAIDATWAVIRTKLHVVLITIPVINRLPKNVKDNVTFEHFVGKNRLEQVRRVFRLPGQKTIDGNLFKPILGNPKKFDLYRVPLWAWNKYYTERKKLANEALDQLKAVTNMEDMAGYMTILDGVKYAKNNGVNWGMNTIQQAVSRGMLRGQKINGMLHVEMDSLKDAIEVETMPMIEE